MLELRHYQESAVNALFNYFENETGNPLVVLPTATGKSLVIAEFTRRAMLSYPDTRIVVATHVKELVAQNYLEFYHCCPEISAGIHSAGLRKKDMHHKVLFCGIQSIFRKAFDLGRVDILIIDEAHTVPKAGEGMWLTFIAALKISNPHLKVIGMSATPFRLDTGLLTEGEKRIFTDVCYEYPLLQAVEDGFICMPVPKPTTTTYDISNVGKRGGEYVPGELDAAFDVDEKTVAAINEIVEYGKDRNCWLIFAAGNKHAASIKEELDRRGISAAIVTQDTSDSDREKAVNDIKNFGIKALINNLIFTTGFNAKPIDMIACFRPTKSKGLWVQICGRGFRLHESKNDCLILDFGRNSDRHGPLDKITGRKDVGEGGGGVPIKTCPHCKATCFAACMTCPDCGKPFPERVVDITPVASHSSILSSQEAKEKPFWNKVISTQHSRHKGKNGKKDTLRAKYITYTGDYSQYVCIEHAGFAREKACHWHKMRLPDVPIPSSIDAALALNYPNISEVLVQKNGKFFEVLAVKISDEADERLPEPETLPSGNILMDCEDIPF